MKEIALPSLLFKVFRVSADMSQYVISLLWLHYSIPYSTCKHEYIADSYGSFYFCNYFIAFGILLHLIFVKNVFHILSFVILQKLMCGNLSVIGYLLTELSPS
jgi:hypothetical protein